MSKLRATTSVYLRKAKEPAEPDPGPDWLRSRFMSTYWPRPGVAACGRRECPGCGEPPIPSKAPQPELEERTR